MYRLKRVHTDFSKPLIRDEADHWMPPA